MAKLEKLLQEASKHLEAGEAVECAVMGAYDVKIGGNDSLAQGVAVATDRRFLFFAKKAFSGYQLESFAYPSISSFEQSRGTMGGTVSFTVSGNRATVKWIPVDEAFNRFCELMRQRVGQPSTPSAPAADGEGDVLAKIGQMAVLYRQGVLSAEAFAEATAKLVS